MKNTSLLSLTAAVLIATSLCFTAPVKAADSNSVDLVGEGSAPTVPAGVETTAKQYTPTPKKGSAKVAHEEVADATPHVAIENEYQIQPGDVLQITVWKEEALDREVLVLPDGTISFPLIESFCVKGLTPQQVQSDVKSKLHSFIPDASVAVLVKAPLGHSVNVIGQVVKSGEVVMGRNLTVMQALSQAGGLTPFASESGIIVLRRVNGKATSIPFPYDDVVDGDNLEKDITLLPGDVVVVPTASLF